MFTESYILFQVLQYGPNNEATALVVKVMGSTEHSQYQASYMLFSSQEEGLSNLAASSDILDTSQAAFYITPNDSSSLQYYGYQEGARTHTYAGYLPENGTTVWGNHTLELWSNETLLDEPAKELARDISLGVLLGALSMITFVGNAMVLHAVRTEKRLQTVSYILYL